jgi:hypothetical protein
LNHVSDFERVLIAENLLTEEEVTTAIPTAWEDPETIKSWMANVAVVHFVERNFQLHMSQPCCSQRWAFVPISERTGMNRYEKYRAQQEPAEWKTYRDHYCTCASLYVQYRFRADIYVKWNEKSDASAIDYLCSFELCVLRACGRDRSMYNSVMEWLTGDRFQNLPQEWILVIGAELLRSKLYEDYRPLFIRAQKAMKASQEEQDAEVDTTDKSSLTQIVGSLDEVRHESASLIEHDPIIALATSESDEISI